MIKTASSSRLIRLACTAPLGVACALVAAVSSSPAAGQPSEPDAPISVRVGYADLNLATTAGARAMLARIRAAASQACGSEPDMRDLNRISIYNRCRNQAVAHALAALDVPLVTALANGATNVELSRR